jgi:epsilon-lactone hydrolase
MLVSSALRHLVKRRNEGDVNVAYVRSWVNRLMALPWPHRSVTFQDFGYEGLRGEWVCSGGAARERVVLYFHGGGYFFCSPRTHRPVTVGLAKKLGAATLALQYRLAPENPFPAALDDAVAAYRWLLAQGILPRNVAFAGDSAGGGLALAALVSLRDQGVPLPSACVCFSPWTDLAATGASLDQNDAHCAMFSAAGIRRARLLYVGSADPYHPHVSPLYADLSGLPPLLVHVSDSEVLLDDSTRLVERARAAGVKTQLKVWSRLPHVWQLFCRLIPEGGTSLEEAAEFLSMHLGGGAELPSHGLPFGLP